MKKLLALGLGLIFSQMALADFVYMKETAEGKTVHLQGKSGEIRTLNVGSDWALYPDITPDGEEFIYVEGAGPTDLHLTYHHPAKQLTQRFNLVEKGMLLHPKFSKNGRLIFFSAPGKSGKNTIYYFNRLETVLEQGPGLSDYSLENAVVLSPDEEAYFPRPSSDGNFVVYQRNGNGKKEIVLFDRLENTKTVLAEGMSPALSFDERLVAFTAKKNGNWNIFIIDRITKEVQEMTSDSHDEMAPTFLPDNTLAFASNKSGHYELFKLKNKKWESLVTSTESVEADFYSPQFSGSKHFKQSELKPFMGNPRSSFGTVSLHGKIYMAGGHQGAEHTYPPESFTDTFIVYDQSTNEWQELAPRPVKAHGYQLAASDDYIYAFGGFAYSEIHKPKWKSLSQIDRYDIKNNTWKTIGHLKTPRSSNVAANINGKVYLVGGWDSTPKFENDMDGNFLNSVEVFDLKTEEISEASFRMPLPLRRALTGTVYQNKILLVGGLGVGASHFELLQNVTLIDPSVGEATELDPLPFATFAPAADVIDNKLFVFGGMFKTGAMNYEYVSHIYQYDFLSKIWGHTGRFLKETKGFSQVFSLGDSTLGVLGGHHYQEGMDTPVSTFETFQIKE